MPHLHTLTTSEFTAEIAAKHKRDGLTNEQISRLYEVSETTVRRRLRSIDPALSGRPSSLPSTDDGYVEMPVIVRDYSHLNHLRVFPLGDVHIGSTAHDARRWHEWLDFLGSDEHMTVIGTGDFLEGCLKDDPRGEVYDATMTYQEAKWRCTEDFRPISANIDVLIPGNHEADITRRTGDEPVYDIARNLGVPYARGSCIVVYLVGSQRYTFHVWHGKKGGESAMKSQRLAVLADVYVQGHTHQPEAKPFDSFDFDPKTKSMVRRPYMLVTSGSFQRYPLYASVSSYSPTPIGAPQIRLDGRQFNVQTTVST